ncbi:hypothetical protein Bca52824_081568 [Brassica carinata]|uniref:Uncharacterized protein n=1 Tax=Brassica carinata TaxID=52824 RepID=A0A8X7TRD6_BRACI|nr:hypothetical protein Bca52824_081568 [Brassica carinata]
MDQQSEPVTYVCGGKLTPIFVVISALCFLLIIGEEMPLLSSLMNPNCGQKNTLKSGDVIQCRERGYRILYKKRTRRVVQYEAR